MTVTFFHSSVPSDVSFRYRFSESKRLLTEIGDGGVIIVRQRPWNEVGVKPSGTPGFVFESRRNDDCLINDRNENTLGT